VAAFAIDYHSDRAGSTRIDRARHPIPTRGDHVARAKRTDRSEARRKYRAYLQAQEEAALADVESPDSAAVTKSASGVEAKTKRVEGSQGVAPGARLGIFAAARAAYRTPHYRDDIRDIRSLVLHTKAVWPVLLMCIAGGLYIVTRISRDGTTSDPFVTVIAEFLFVPVPLIPPMMAGFFAPKASWLAGLLAAFIATTAFLVVIAFTTLKVTDTGTIAISSPSPSGPVVTASASPVSSVGATLTTAPGGSPAASAVAAAGSPTPSPSGNGSGTTSGTTTLELLPSALALFAQSLAFGALIGAASGWYKRFLGMTSGPRKPPPSKSGSGRSGSRKPGSGRVAQRGRPATRS
jgi:hypothetical protein